MIIEEGYWNYYMAFQVKSGSDIEEAIAEGKLNSTIVATYIEGHVIENTSLKKDNDGILNIYFDKMKRILKETGDAVAGVYGEATRYISSISLMSPIRIMIKNKGYITCPVFMYLMNTGLGILKLRLPLYDVDAEFFKSNPLKKWFKDEHMIKADGERFIRKDAIKNEESINDIVEFLRYIIQNSFQGHLISGKMNLSFESILLSKTKKPNILDKGLRLEEEKEIYHICYPENYFENPNSSKVNNFWEENNRNIGGISFIMGEPARMIIYADVDKILKWKKREGCDNTLEYFENSVQYSYDWPISLALMKKLNEMNLFYSSNGNYHSINYNNAIYNLKANELDSMFDLCSSNSKRVFDIVMKIMNDSLNSYDERVDRLWKLEYYFKNRMVEKRNILFEGIALCGTTLFGLPAIRETLFIIKEACFGKEIDLINGISISGISIALWVLMIIFLGYELIKNARQYKKYRFN